MKIPSLLNPSTADETDNTNGIASQDPSDAKPQTDHAPASYAQPAPQLQAHPTASLPGEGKGKHKRLASNSPHPDSPTIALRRKRTRPNLKISPAEANSRFSPGQSSTPATAFKPGDQAPATTKHPLGLGIEGLTSSGESSNLNNATAGASTSISPLKGPVTSLASSFGQLFRDAGEDAPDKEHGEHDADTKMKEEDETDDEEDDGVMASLEAAEPDQLPHDIDMGSPTPPPSPLFTQRRRQQKQPRRSFSIVEAIMDQNDMFLNMCNYLDLHTFFNLYCTSKKFYVLVNSHYATHMQQLSRNHAPLARTIFPYQLYKRTCIQDPMLRPRPPTSTTNPQQGAAGTAPTRTLPGLRWVHMCAYRESLTHDMLLALALEGHRFPACVPSAILRTWALLDMPLNGPRLAAVHDTRLWTNRDIFLALMFFIKLDMRFADPILGNGECMLRRILLGQKSLVVLWEALRGVAVRTQVELIHMMVRWDYQVHGEVEEGDEVFGVPIEEVGALSREGWRQGGEYLLRPDELLLREAMRRRLNMHRCFLDFMLWGYVNWTWMEEVPLPDLEKLELSDRKRRGEKVDEEGEEDEDDDVRKLSHGSLKEMFAHARAGSGSDGQ